MRRLVATCIMVILAVAIYAQNDVTTFLGIPVDGLKSEMRKKLIAKGYEPQTVGDSECFQGEFNGTDVNIFIVTNNNKVFRIMVCDRTTRSEADIKIRFNKLISQFKNNKRYASLDDYTLSESEDISYGMKIDNKNYDALFYQVPDAEKIDTLTMQGLVMDELRQKYSQDQIENATEDIKIEAQSIATRLAIEMLLKKPVWFRICEHYGEYYITMFYDNEYNHANGEDL